MENLLKIFLLIILLYGCEDVIDLELPESEPKLVIEASINKSFNISSCENCWVKLTLSSPFFIDKVQPVTDAEVKIIDISNNITYNFIHNPNNFSDGYYYSDPVFIPDFNTDYKLVIIYDNEIYESTIEKLVPTVAIDKLEQGDGTLFEGNEKELIVSYTDDGSREDFYLFRFASNLYLTTEDKFYQGNEFSFSYFIPEENANNEIFVSIFGIDQRYFNYMTILIEQTEDRGNPFGTAPVNARGNIKNITNPENYPLGYFRLAETDTKSIVLE